MNYGRGSPERLGDLTEVTQQVNREAIAVKCVHSAVGMALKGLTAARMSS
jgi:hypothetical protein